MPFAAALSTAAPTQEALADPLTQTFIDNMIVTMVEYHGVGLAAPQVYESLCIAVIESKGPRGDIPLTVLVNPDVTVLDEQMIEDWEGCLSIPQLRGRVPRYRKLRVDALDRFGRITSVCNHFYETYHPVSTSRFCDRCKRSPRGTTESPVGERDGAFRINGYRSVLLHAARSTRFTCDGAACRCLGNDRLREHAGP